jgi:hypothetical protein
VRQPGVTRAAPGDQPGREPGPSRMLAARQGQHFFLAKKKQKTLFHKTRVPKTPRQRAKVFLVLFCKKERFLLECLAELFKR